jgi:hypothetical protein
MTILANWTMGQAIENKNGTKTKTAAETHQIKEPK